LGNTVKFSTLKHTVLINKNQKVNETNQAGVYKETSK